MAVSVYSDPWPYAVLYSRLLPPDTQYIRPSTQNTTYNAEDEFEMLKSHDQALKFEEIVEIRKQSAVEEAEEPEPGSKERIVTDLKLTESLGVTEVGIEVF
jgi:hypothetical protein